MGEHPLSMPSAEASKSLSASMWNLRQPSSRSSNRSSRTSVLCNLGAQPCACLAARDPMAACGRRSNTSVIDDPTEHEDATLLCRQAPAPTKGA